MKRLLALGLLSLTLGTSLKAQVTERPRPVEWERTSNRTSSPGRVGTVSAGCTLYGPLFADV